MSIVMSSHWKDWNILIEDAVGHSVIENHGFETF